MRFWSYGAHLRVCSYALCAAGDAEILSCTDGFASATGPDGEPGCCWEKVWRDDPLVMDVECDGISGSPLVRMKVESPGGGACTPYALRSFSY
jgi:hypothetical protein